MTSFECLHFKTRLNQSKSEVYTIHCVKWLMYTFYTKASVLLDRLLGNLFGKYSPIKGPSSTMGIAEKVCHLTVFGQHVIIITVVINMYDNYFQKRGHKSTEHNRGRSILWPKTACSSVRWRWYSRYSELHNSISGFDITSPVWDKHCNHFYYHCTWWSYIMRYYHYFILMNNEYISQPTKLQPFNQSIFFSDWLFDDLSFCLSLLFLITIIIFNVGN